MRDCPLIYPDSDMYLDLITRNEALHKKTGQPRWLSAKAVFEGIEVGYARMAVSPLIEAEVLINGSTRERSARSPRVAEMLGTWFTSPQTLWVDIDRFLVREALRLREEYGRFHQGSKPFKSADALHLAAALRAKCRYFMTHDEGFPIGMAVDGMEVIRPEVVWPEPLPFEEPEP
ncbi:type II toxin-antitoxin system VapC family toxin [Sphaerimonospora cavernae]|uniref:Type II toxin-antitoxin system VapC family toxin n=1 Tax=Sphaerimonospora cavernae TaxID=1740611 RepID=A0ABV6U0A8_9ACTN